MNEHKNIPLATEIIRSQKHIIWFLITLEFLTIFGFIGGFLIYTHIPDKETTSIEQESDGESYNQVIGGDYNGEQTESNDN